MLTRPGVQAAGVTDVGCQRENNEDNFAYWEPESDAQFLEKGRLAVVADGMGGYQGGQEASRLAVETIVNVYRSTDGAAPQDLLLTALRSAHEQIRQQAAANPTLYGMGTTCTSAAITGRKLVFAHVGDSRLYLIRDNAISQLSRDHSYVGRLVESGLISRDEAELHPHRHILTAALGTVGELVADTPEAGIELRPGDILVLCTDGLWGQVRDPEIQATVSEKNAEEACAALVALARQRGGPDNITVQVLRIESLA